jgi:hypothetical protein
VTASQKTVHRLPRQKAEALGLVLETDQILQGCINSLQIFIFSTICFDCCKSPNSPSPNHRASSSCQTSPFYQKQICNSIRNPGILITKLWSYTTSSYQRFMIVL